MLVGRAATFMSALVAIASAPHTATARDLRADFRSAIVATHPRVSFRIIEERSGDSPVLVARFKVRARNSFQNIALAPDADAGPCTRDTPAEDFKLDILGAGPGGAAFALRFCAGGRAFRLVNSNSMSSRDTDHGVTLDRLATSLQNALR